jgi:hypothetical protein
MRQWLVNPGLLCDQHLRGEHVEHHMFVGSINKGISIRGYISDGLVEPGKLRERHDELEDEMIRRGMKPNSPLPAINWDRYNTFTGIPLENCKVDRSRSINELHKRCPRCAERIEQVGLGHAVR